MKFDSPLFDRIRVKPTQDRAREARRAVLPVEGLRQHGDASRAEGAEQRERVLALLPRARARVQPLLQLLLRHERRRRDEVPEGRGHRAPPDLEDGHRQPPGRRRRFRSAGAAAIRSTCSASSARAAPMRASARPSRARTVRNAERKALHELGLEEGADKVEIKARFKVLVKRHHPDANGGDRAMRRQAARDHPGVQLSEVSRRC